jgi:hypothetical protein
MLLRLVVLLIVCHSLSSSDLPFFSSSALEEQLAASHHEMEEARLWEVLLMEDHERVVVARVQQRASVALAALQLCTS